MEIFFLNKLTKEFDLKIFYVGNNIICMHQYLCVHKKSFSVSMYIYLKVQYLIRVTTKFSDIYAQLSAWFSCMQFYTLLNYYNYYFETVQISSAKIFIFNFKFLLYILCIICLQNQLYCASVFFFSLFGAKLEIQGGTSLLIPWLLQWSRGRYLPLLSKAHTTSNTQS